MTAVVKDTRQRNDTSTTSPRAAHRGIRPRLLYASIFIWISITGGRFLAALLENASLTDAQIGFTLALQTVIQSLFSSAAGIWADSVERRYPGRGRARVLVGGIVVASLAFLCQGLLPFCLGSSDGESLTTAAVTDDTKDDEDNDRSGSPTNKLLAWHVVLRCIYAASTSMVFPVLDGLTLEFLAQRDDDKSDATKTNDGQADFGKERLWGAVSWAITNLILGPSLDMWGFSILYIYGAVSTLGVIVTVMTYTASQQRQQKGYSKIGTATRASSTTTLSTSVEDGFHDEEEDDQPIIAPDDLISQQSRGTESPKDSNTARANFPFHKLLKLIFATTFGAAFMLAIFCLSIGTAVVESLIFLYFESLGSSFTLCALTVLLTVLFEIPIFHVAPKLLKTYGSTKMLLLACVCYMTRVVGYSIVPDGQPWWVLLFEPLHGITYACASLSSVEFVAQLVPAGYEASGQGMLYSLRGCGSVVGLLFGGYGEDVLGPRTMYRVLATIVTIGFGVLSLASFWESRSQKSQRESSLGQRRKETGVEINGDDAHTAVELVGAQIS